MQLARYLDKLFQNDGFELDSFDAAKKFRKYQIYYLKKYIKDPFLEVGAGQGGLVNLYKIHSRLFIDFIRILTVKLDKPF